MTSEERWLERALELAVQSVAEGGGPFGAVVVAAGETLLGEGRNRVALDLDPTAHAEVMAIRSACRELGDFSLAGATLYSSCEPCPLCLSAALWARLDRVVYAADRADAARGGFDDSAFYDLWTRDRGAWELPRVEQNRVPEATRPFEAWLAEEGRIRY